MTKNINHSPKRVSLDNLPRKSIYSVSDDYFDKLPTRIQEQVTTRNKQSAPAYIWSISMKLALPLIALVIMVVYFGSRITNNELDIQAMLDEIPTEELVNYLNESEISTDELLSLIDIEELDIDGMMEENVMLFNDEELDIILNEFPELESEIK